MKKLKYVIMLIALFLALPAALGAAWTTKRLTNNAGWSSGSSIAASNENVYVAWADSTSGNNEIYFRKSSDGGSTWQSSQMITNNAGHSQIPVLAASGQTIYVVWDDDSPGNREIYFNKSTDGGSTWQTAKQLTNNIGYSYRSQIAISNDIVYVAWTDDTSGHNEIYFRKSTDRGATWQSAKRITNHACNSNSPALAVNGENVYVMYCSDASGNNEIYFKKSADSGATWLTAKRLTNNAGISVTQNKSMAANGANIYVVWRDETPGNMEVYFKKSTNRGETWHNSKRLTTNAGESSLPVIASSGANIYVVWMDGTPGNSEIYLKKSTDNGSNWQASQRVTANSGNSFWPAVALNSATIFVTWSDDYQTPGSCEVYLKYSPLF